MKPMELAQRGYTRSGPMKAGPLAHADGSLTPRGRYAAAAFCRAFAPLRRLALRTRLTRRNALKYLALHGADELESLCGEAVMLGVRRFRPGGPAKKLSTVVTLAVWGLLAEHFRRPAGGRVPVWTNQDGGPGAEGPDATLFDRLPGPVPPEAGAAGVAAADRLAALVATAARVPDTRLTDRELYCAVQHLGHGLKLREVAEVLGFSKERTRQVVASAVRKLSAAAGRFPPL